MAHRAQVDARDGLRGQDSLGQRCVVAARHARPLARLVLESHLGVGVVVRNIEKL